MIEIIQGDITKQDADAIVNAAHEKLEGGGGVDGAIHRAAGPGLMRECRTIQFQEPGIRCRPGEAYITSGCRLAARYVIHTVAPRFVGSAAKAHQWTLTRDLYKNARPGTEAELANCYRNAIMLAGENALKSIAFCSLGTGGHSWPVELACPVAIKTVLESIHDAPTLEVVRFVLFSKQDFDYYNMVHQQMSAGG
jgi:O-acetyl-ADP-ribose deacetylase (regulator of RNase III)